MEISREEEEKTEAPPLPPPTPASLRPSLSTPPSWSLGALSLSLRNSFSEATPRGSLAAGDSDDISATVPVLDRSMSGTFGLSGLPLPFGGGVRETVYCGICLENVEATTCTHFCGGDEAQPCPHRFCRPCLRRYLRMRVEDGHVETSCPSFGEDGCGAVAAPEDHDRLLANEGELLSKYKRFAMMKKNKNWRDCPSCGAMNLGSEKQPAMVCTECGYGAEGLGAFCFFHSNAHQGMTCAEYIRNEQKMWKMSEVHLSKVSKKCPRCTAPTIKSSGCNHMTCQACKCNWCWLCNTDMDKAVLEENPEEAGDAVGWHYNSRNAKGCAGLQFHHPVPRRFACLYHIWKALFQCLLGTLIACVGLAFGAVWVALFCVLGNLWACFHAWVLRKNAGDRVLLTEEREQALMVLVMGPPVAIGLVLLVLVYSAFTLIWLALALALSPVLGIYLGCCRRWSLGQLWELLWWPSTFLRIENGIFADDVVGEAEDEDEAEQAAVVAASESPMLERASLPGPEEKVDDVKSAHAADIEQPAAS